MKRLALILSALALAAPSNALAGHVRHHRPRHHLVARAVAAPSIGVLQAAALRAASAYWQAAPCGGQPIGLRDAAWPANAGPMPADVAAYADLPGCTIVFVAGAWALAPPATNWDMFCGLVAHEYGHLLGFPHSTDPHNVMYPTPDAGANTPPQCATYRPAGATG